MLYSYKDFITLLPKNYIMLGIVLIYFMAKWIYNLAKKYNKPNAWLYGVLGVITYYGIGLGLTFAIGFAMLMNDPTSLDTQGSELMLSLIAIPLGIGGVALLHYILKRNWSKNASETNSELLDETLDSKL